MVDMGFLNLFSHDQAHHFFIPLTYHARLYGTFHATVTMTLSSNTTKEKDCNHYTDIFLHSP